MSDTRERAAEMLYNACQQALSDMDNGLSVCPATKELLMVAVLVADTGRSATYDSRTNTWTLEAGVQEA